MIIIDYMIHLQIIYFLMCLKLYLMSNCKPNKKKKKMKKGENLKYLWKIFFYLLYWKSLVSNSSMIYRDTSESWELQDNVVRII